MGTRVYSSEESTNVTLTTTAETTVATVSNVNTSKSGETVRLRGEVQLTTGAGTTAVTPRIRRGGLTGTVVNEANPITIGAAAGSTETFEVSADDFLADDVAAQVYVLTLEQTGATGNGTAVYGYLKAEVG